MNKTANDFLKTVRLAFPIFQKTEKRFYHDFASSVNAYTEQFPSCTFEDLITHFGEPKDIVNTYFDSMESSVYFSVMKRVRYLKVMIVSVIIFLFLMLTMTLFFLWHTQKTYKDAAIHDGEIIIEYLNNKEVL